MSAFKATALVAAALALAATARAEATRGFSLEVVLDGGVRPEYRARGAVYVEAVRGRPYVLRIRNPLPVRVGVALAVDGLDTIDARHGDARGAAKWVLGPYETIEIPGWQVDGGAARRFFFTGERSSYGAWLGKTENLGVIEAAFFRERARPVRAVPRPVQPRAQAPPPPPRFLQGAPSADSEGSAGGISAGVLGGVPGGVPGPEAIGVPEAAPPPERKASDEYAATGIGERTPHGVEWVDLDLEDRPAAVVRIRYEFRDALVRLGVLPATPDPLVRREGARGFSGGYCPDPFGGR